MMALFLKLTLAHLTGDFLLQSQQWVTHKRKHKLKSKFLYWHILVHLCCLVLVLQFDINYILGITIILVSHYIFDVIKLYLETKTNSRWLFGLDQLAHFIVIALVVHIYFPYDFNIHFFFETKTLLFLTALLCITQVASILMKTLISKWDMDSHNKASLKHAGAYIGVLERLFVFAFIVTDHWEGIGFLITAKSVFRFGDLSKAKDRKLTEYVLIGTLVSFGLAMVCGLGYEYAFWLIKTE